MSPQPHRGSGSGIIGGPSAIKRVSDEVAARIFRYLATWAHVDACRERLAIALMEADHRAAYAIMGAITSAPARSAAVRAAAREVRPDDAELVDWVLKQLKDVDAQRNRFAHHLVMTPLPDRPDAIAFLDPKDLSAHVAELSSLKWEPAADGSLEVEVPTHVHERIVYQQKAMVYTAEEIDGLQATLMERLRLVSDLEAALSNAARTPGMGRATDAARSRLLSKFEAWKSERGKDGTPPG